MPVRPPIKLIAIVAKEPVVRHFAAEEPSIQVALCRLFSLWNMLSLTIAQPAWNQVWLLRCMLRKGKKP
jgi:hypothetical protein